MARRRVDVAPPPRTLGGKVHAQVLFGSGFGQICWLAFAASMLFAGVFTARSEVRNFWEFRGELATTEGQVDRLAATSASENEQPIWAFEYGYEVAGKPFRGRSYDLGSPRLEAGARATVEYLAADPARSRLRGMRRHEFGSEVAFVLLFPALGFVGGLVTFVRGLGHRRILRSGMLAWGKLVSNRPTSTTVNDKPVRELTFEFRVKRPRAPEPSAAGGPFRVAGKPSEVERRPAPHRHYRTKWRTHEIDRLTDGRKEPLLYDPARPERAVMLDGLPGRTGVGRDGNLVTHGVVWRAIGAPAAAVLATIIAAVMMLA